MKKSLLLTFIIFLLLPFSLFSQSPQIKPSWDLMPSDGPTHEVMGLLPCNIVKTNDNNFLVPFIYSGYEINCAKIIKFDNDGEILQETELQFDENYYVKNAILDIWNDTVNIIAHLIEKEMNSTVILHAYLFDDLSMSEPDELWRKDFDGIEWMPLTCDCPLIDANGFRTFNYEYFIKEPEKKSFVAFLKFDNKFSLISEKIYEAKSDLNSAAASSDNLSYNADSTQYYYVSYAYDYPYCHFMNVLDLNFNLVEQIPLESNPPIFLQTFTGHWHQNSYDGQIYTIGTLTAPPSINSEIYSAKLDVDNYEVDFLRLSYTPEDIYNAVVLEQGMCFLPDGKIIGCGTYDVGLFFEYKPDAYYAYIPVFDTDMQKQSEWYYTLGAIYNQHLYHIYPTEDNGIILLGAVRFMKDDEIYWEPYIVKFPASAFDTDNIEEAHAHGLKAAIAYPNPGGDVMNIRTGLRNATLQVYDMQGRKVYEQEITDDVTSIDASRWNSGTYVWQLKTENEKLNVEEGKWVKE